MQARRYGLRVGPGCPGSEPEPPPRRPPGAAPAARRQWHGTVNPMLIGLDQQVCRTRMLVYVRGPRPARDSIQFKFSDWRPGPGGRRPPLNSATKLQNVEGKRHCVVAIPENTH